VVGRALLRLRLGAYLARDPKSLRFAYNEFGKPSVADETELRFNVSHAEDCALYAFTLSGDVGVDVEPVRAGQVHDEVAHRFFARPEVEALERLPPERRGEAFADCWTRKEAFIKARGDGLSAALDTFVVSLPDEPPALLWTAWSAIEPGEWCFADLSALTPGYIAAIAVRARRLDVVIDEWEPTRA
jgi:4'-phosphopantetheinyl transferase